MVVTVKLLKKVKKKTINDFSLIVYPMNRIENE